MTGRVAVIGDLAGHLAEVRGELVRLGADPTTLRLPDDLVVVQVGDLVHRGPEPEGVIALVDRYLREQPRQWVQLAGNHEAQYLHEPVFEWPERIADEAAELLMQWWIAGAMRVAVAVRTAHETFLVTHAGLTEGYWRQALDAPADAAQAAAAIDSFRGTHEHVLFAHGQMLGGGEPNFVAGPMWAAAATELVPSWLGTPLPFSQVYGHSTIMDWKQKRLRCTTEIAALVSVDVERKHEHVALPGGRIVGVDPGHGAKPRRPWQAYVLDDAVVL